jgi:DNA-binding response OmpR family regulator
MKVLIVEDDLPLSDVLVFTLRRAGYDPFTAHDGLAALQLWRTVQPDFILLDLNLPKLDGLVVCRQIRGETDIPLIILSVRGREEDVIKGLELGADDYIVKPFSPGELVARMQAVLRRVGQTAPAAELVVGSLTLDRSRNEAWRDGEGPIRLTPLEAALLEKLMLNPGRIVTRDNLIGALWPAEGGDRTMLKQLVYRLRAKIEPDPSNPAFIETVAGLGYGFVADDG